IVSMSIEQDAFTCANVGLNTVVLTVTDASGNVSTAEATVTVLDETDPEVACLDLTVELDSDGLAFITPQDVANASADNCAITISAIDIDSFDCNDIGTPVQVNYFAADASGNLASCSAMVTVVDVLAPVIDCIDDISVAVDSGSFYVLPDYYTSQ